jgi:hypothetical protein
MFELLRSLQSHELVQFTWILDDHGFLHIIIVGVYMFLGLAILSWIIVIGIS